MLEREDIKKIAHLSRISLSEEEIERQLQELSKIMEMMDLLKEINTDGVAPLNHVLNLENVFREDEVKASLPVEKVLANAPEEYDNMFSVPKVV